MNFNKIVKKIDNPTPKLKVKVKQYRQNKENGKISHLVEHESDPLFE